MSEFSTAEIALLQQNPLLADLEATAATAILSQCRRLVLGNDATVLDRQSRNRDVFILVQGSVRVINFATNGREISFADLKPGNWFGEIAAIDGGERTAQVVTTAPTVLAVMPPEVFMSLLRQNPDAVLLVLRKLAGIIRSCDNRIMDLATQSAIHRVYRALDLRKLPDPVVKGRWIIHPLPTQNDIAAEAGTTRETVARVIGELSRGEIVWRKGRTLYITDPDRFAQLLNQDSN